MFRDVIRGLITRRCPDFVPLCRRTGRECAVRFRDDCSGTWQHRADVARCSADGLSASAQSVPRCRAPKGGGASRQTVRWRLAASTGPLFDDVMLRFRTKLLNSESSQTNLLSLLCNENYSFDQQATIAPWCVQPVPLS
jgi:hypothetical protein